MAFCPLDALLDPMLIPIDGVVFAWEMDADQSHEIQPDQNRSGVSNDSKVSLATPQPFQYACKVGCGKPRSRPVKDPLTRKPRPLLTFKRGALVTAVSRMKWR